jgi:hypothetical protein
MNRNLARAVAIGVTATAFGIGMATFSAVVYSWDNGWGFWEYACGALARG